MLLQFIAAGPVFFNANIRRAGAMNALLAGGFVRVIWQSDHCACGVITERGVAALEGAA